MNQASEKKEKTPKTASKGGLRGLIQISVLLVLIGYVFYSAYSEYKRRTTASRLKFGTIVPCGKDDYLRSVYDTGFGRFCLERENRDLIKTQLKNNIPWEEHVFDTMKARLKAGDTALDVGAHIGTHTLELSRLVGPEGLVVAFEPQLKIYQELLVNLELNEVKNVRAEMVALGDAPSRVTMEAADINNEGATKLGHGGNIVEVRTLDSYHFDKISFMKIDVEGFEKYVLGGAKQTVLRHKPVMVIEIQPQNREAVDPILSELGYSVSSIGGGWDYLALPAS